MLKKLISELKNKRFDILFEVFSLFLGLTAALWLDDYRDKKKEDEFNKRMILDIRGEYKEIAKLDKEIQINLKFVDTLKFFANKSFVEIENLNLYDKKLLEKIKKEQNGKFALVDIMILTKADFNDSAIYNTSWQILSNQNLTSIDFELIKLLGEIENTRETVEFQANKLVTKYNVYEPLNTYDLRGMTNILANMENSRFYLIQNVKEFLAKTEKYEKEK
jgi:hypothetical protein